VALPELYRQARRWLKVTLKDTGNLEPTPWDKQQFLLDLEYIDVEENSSCIWYI
jgi:hypothetical protein